MESERAVHHHPLKGRRDHMHLDEKLRRHPLEKAREVSYPGKAIVEVVVIVVVVVIKGIVLVLMLVLAS